MKEKPMMMGQIYARGVDMNKKQIILNDRDLQVFRFIDKYRVVSAKSVLFACGFQSIRYLQERIKKFVEYNYINRHTIYLGYPHFFSLTTKGLREIGVKARAYKPSYATAMHYVSVADTAAYVSYQYGLDAVKDFYADKDFYHNQEVIRRYQLKTSHKPDLIFTTDDKTYFVEVERSRKGKKKTMKNILMNYLEDVHQIWVLDNISFDDIKKECAQMEHYKEAVTFMEYSEIVQELRRLGGG